MKMKKKQIIFDLISVAIVRSDYAYATVHDGYGRRSRQRNVTPQNNQRSRTVLQHNK